MSYNPYASPQAAPAPAGPPHIPQGPPQPWEIGEVLKAAWELYKIHWVTLTFGYVLVAIVGSVPGQVPGVLVQAGVVEPNSTEYWAIYTPFALVGWLIGEFFGAGFVLTILNAMRTGQASIGDFFRAGSRFLPYLGMSFLRMIGMVIGLLLLIVPGVVFGLGISLAPYYVIEQHKGPIEALSASWEATKGHKGNLFLLGIVEFFLVIAGMLACCVGLFVVIPVIAVAQAIVYTRLSGTAPPPGDAGGGYGAPPPPGYGGGPPPGFGGPPPPPGGFGAPPPAYGPSR